MEVEGCSLRLRPEGGVEGYSDFSICYRAEKNEQDEKTGG